MSEEQVVEVEVKKPRGRQAVDKVAKALSTPFSGAPKAKVLDAKVKDVKEVEVLIQTPSGRLDKKIYQTFRTATGRYRKLLRIIKGVKG